MEIRIHPYAEIFPIMTEREIDELAKDIRVNGLKESIWVWNGNIIDGRNRYLACQRAGVEPIYREWNGEGDILSFIVSLNLHRRHLNESQRAIVGAEIKPLFEQEARKRQGQRTDLCANVHKGEPVHTKNRVAELVNVSPRSIETASKVIREAVPELVEAVRQGDVSVSAAATVSILSKEEQTEIVEQGPKAIVEAAHDIRNHRTIGTGENEWYTPKEYIEVVREFLGGIDLDPASSDKAQETVKAARYFTIEDDGLSKAWEGKIWLNPPYSQPTIRHFIEKLVAEYKAGTTVEAVALTHNYTDTAWFHHALDACSAVCLTRGRIGFLSPEGKKAAPTQGQVFFYFGKNFKEFASAFADFGKVLFNGQL